MDSRQAEPGKITINRLLIRYMVPGDHPNPERVRGQLDELARRDLARSLARAVAAWSSSDERIWFIRRLELDLTVDVTRPDEEVAGQWGGAISLAIARRLRASAEDSGVVVFRNRAEYLGRFVVDLAGGRAWERWYYEPFAGLRPASVSAAIRSALCDEPEIGLAALTALQDRSLVATISALTPHDAARVLDQLAEGTPPAPDEPMSRVLAAWPRLGASGDGIERRALHLFVTASMGDPLLAGRPLRDVVRAVAWLASLRARDRAAADRFLDVPAGQGIPGAATIAGIETVLPILDSPADGRAALRAMFTQDADGQHSTEPASSGPREAHWGGMFLLLPMLDRLPLDAATEGWPPAGETSAVSLVRLLILARCAGRHARLNVFADPVARELVRVDPGLDRATVVRWGRGIDPSMVKRFHETLGSWWEEEGGVQRMALVRVPRPGAPLGILVDLQRSVWLFAAGYHPRHPRHILERLPASIAHLLADAELLIADPPFADLIDREEGGRRVVRRDDAPLLDAGGNSGLAEAIVRLDQLPRDLEFLTPDARDRLLSPFFDTAITVAAQWVLRALSRRLPGFALSSLPYLALNFFDVRGSIVEEPERRVVRLGRPPLNLILSLTGISRGAYLLSWLDDRPFVLFQEDDG